MATKSQVNVRLDPMQRKLLRGLEGFYGSSEGEIARYLIVEALEQKHGLESLRRKKAIR
jgi:hypothetical protein